MTAGLGADAAAFAAIAVLGGLVWIAGSAALGPAPAAERVGVGIQCLAAGAWLVMLQPLAGVSVVGTPWALRGGPCGCAGGRGRPALVLQLSGMGVAPAVAITAAGLVVSAAAWLVPGDDYPARYTDILWHEGWIRQLVGGGKAPGGVYADVPNAYPWLEHALAALIMSTGGLAMTPTLIAVEAVMLAALATGTWLLAVELELGSAASAWAAVLAVAGGGIGWAQAAGPAAATITASRADRASTPAGLLRFQRGLGHYGGDLLLSPAPTPALGNVPPAMPRELGIALLPLAAWAAVRAAQRSSPRWWAAAGGAAGLAFLASPVAGIVAVIVATAVAAVHRSRAAVVAIPVVVLVTAVWLGPLAWHTADLAGLVNTTRGAPIEPTAIQALDALAVLVALGAVGAVLAARSHAPDRRSLAAVTIALVGPAVVAAAIPGVDAVPALTRALHYLPAAALGLALPAGFAAAWLVGRVGRSWRLACATAIAVVAIASAATASAGMVEVLDWTDGHPLLSCTATPGGSGQWPSSARRASRRAIAGAHGLRPHRRAAALHLAAPDSLPRRLPPDLGPGAAVRRAPHGRAGGVPPSAVTRILAPAGGPVPPGFRADATCRVATYGAGTTRIVPYRWYVRG